FLILKGIGQFMNLRIPDAELEIGDVAVHGEEAYPTEELVRVGAPASSDGPRSAPPGGTAAPADQASPAGPCRLRIAPGGACAPSAGAGRSAVGQSAAGGPGQGGRRSGG